MNITATSDFHGHLPPINSIPECDLLLIAGDICPVTNHSIYYQRQWLDTKFRRWLLDVPAKQIIGIAGNHDRIFWEMPQMVNELKLPWVYLCDTDALFDGVRIFGSPWTRQFGRTQAFMVQEDHLAIIHSILPKCDILVTHGPPYGCGDHTLEGERVGSKALRDWIATNQPALVVYGHIHEDHGHWNIGDTLVANVTHVDRSYRPIHTPVSFSLDESHLPLYRVRLTR